MVRLARVFVPDQQIAEEVAQETWITVFQKVSDFEGRASLKTWIFRILTNKGKKRGIKEKREVPFTSMSKGDEDREALSADLFLPDGHWKSTPKRWEHETPERLVESEQTRAFILEEIEKLPEKERAVVRLRDIDLFDAAETCLVLEISPVYQRVLLHRGRTRMRATLARFLEQEARPC
jgi:RNA polymerase sigma-70 factor (ECF subfamily)